MFTNFDLISATLSISHSELRVAKYNHHQQTSLVDYCLTSTTTVILSSPSFPAEAPEKLVSGLLIDTEYPYALM